MKRALIFVLVISVCTTAKTQNMVINPGFENWETTSKPTGWTAENCMQESSVHLSGSYSCLQATTTESRNLSQGIPVTPGNVYSLTVNYLTSPSTTGNGCRIWCRWVDATGILFDDDATQDVMQSGYLKSAVWSSLTITVTAPATAVSFNLLIRTLPNSATYWDEIRFEEGTPTLAENHEFEEIKIYPVPAGECLNIENITGISRVEILNLNGSVIKSAGVSGQSSCTIQTSDLTEGIYLVRLTYNNNRTFIRKFTR